MYAVFVGEIFVGVYDDTTSDAQIYPDREDRVIIRIVPPDLLSQMTPPSTLTLADVVEGQGAWGVVNTDEANVRIKRAQAWLAEDTAMAEIGLDDPEARAEVLDYTRAVVTIRNAPPIDGYADWPELPAALKT